MRVADVVVGRVWVGPRDDHHTLLTTARYQITERVAVGQPLTAVVEGDLGGGIGDAAAGAQAGCIAKRALEVVEPEREVERARVVLDQGQLGPAHGAINPARGGGDRGLSPDRGLTDCDRRARRAASSQK